MADVLEVRSGKARQVLPAHTLHLIDTLPLGRRTRIMDVGANPVNRPGYANLAEAGHADVHGFEPGIEAFERLQAQGADHEVYYPFAVGAGEDVTFHVCENRSFSSVFAPDERQIRTLGHWAKSLEVVEKVPVTTINLDEVKGVVAPDMLKMDTQGSELKILEGAQKTLAEAVVIMPELRFFQLYEAEPMMGRVDTKLREMGFMLHKILPGAAVRLTSSRIDRLRPVMTRNQIVDADAIYLRDLARPEALTDRQLAHMALLADAVFTSMDVVLRCLDHLNERGVLKDEDIDTYITKLPRNFRVAAD